MGSTTLVHEVAARVRARWPAVRVEVVSASALTIGLASRSIDVSVENVRAHVAACSDHASREAVLAEFLEGIELAIEPPLDRIEDVIATLRPRDVAQHAMPGSVWAPFAGDLAIAYGFDQPVATRFAPQVAFAALGLGDRARLHERAMANLAGRLPAADAFEDLHEHPGVYVRDHHPLEADRLLLASQWPVIEEALGGAMLAAAPARGVLLIAAPAQVDGLFDATHRISSRHPEPLGRAILRWHAPGWRVNLG